MGENAPGDTILMNVLITIAASLVLLVIGIALRKRGRLASRGAAMLWAVTLPAAPLAWWLVLAALRMLVSRLPLLPNKDIVFAGLVAFTIGQTSQVTEMLTMIAALWLVTHLLLGAMLAAVELAQSEDRR